MMRLRMTINGVCRNTSKGHFYSLKKYNYSQNASTGLGDNIEAPKSAESKRLAEFRKKLRETTPIEDLGEQPDMNPAQKDDPLPPFPDNTNPHTGEVGGPRGPEPTRYGDWERKGRCQDKSETPMKWPTQRPALPSWDLVGHFIHSRENWMSQSAWQHIITDRRKLHSELLHDLKLLANLR